MQLAVQRSNEMIRSLQMTVLFVQGGVYDQVLEPYTNKPNQPHLGNSGGSNYCSVSGK